VRPIQFGTPEVVQSMFGTLPAADQAKVVGGTLSPVLGL